MWAQALATVVGAGSKSAPAQPVDFSRNDSSSVGDSIRNMNPGNVAINVQTGTGAKNSAFDQRAEGHLSTAKGAQAPLPINQTTMLYIVGGVLLIGLAIWALFRK